MQARVKDAFLTALIAALLALPLAGVRTEDGINGMVIDWRLAAVGMAAVLVFSGRLLWGVVEQDQRLGLVGFILGISSLFLPFPTNFLKVAAVGIGLLVALKSLLLLGGGRRLRADIMSLKALASEAPIQP